MGVMLLDGKEWWKSKTVWGGVVAFMASALGFYGVALGEDEKVTLTDALTDLVPSIVALGGSLVSIYGRLVAKKQITK